MKQPELVSPIRLGDRVRDRVSGFTGLATARAEYLFSVPCIQVMPDSEASGKPPECVWMEEPRLERIPEKREAGFNSQPPSGALAPIVRRNLA